MPTWQVWVNGKPDLVGESESLDRALSLAAEHARRGDAVIIAQPEATSALVLQAIHGIRTPVEKRPVA